MINLEKMWLHINGVNRMIVYNPKKDTLADVLRRLGLTGTKIGCGAGQCGACSVILDGKVVRACITKVSRIREKAEILTIEGIGTPFNLHPLQQAWITYGGVQCGFCTPGFIISAYALLQNNPSPNREEVRDWFTKNKNLCRCTGYKPLVDATMAAAAVMRGEKTMDDITYHQEGESIYNSRYPKPTGVEKVTGLADYGDDMGLKMPEGTLHLAPVLPDAHHANIINVDITEAEAYPGVVKVITAKDVPGMNKCDFTAPNHGHIAPPASGFFRPLIAGDKIRENGDVVAMVAAYTEEAARAAAKLVKVELEVLPEYETIMESLKPDAQNVLTDKIGNIWDAYRIDKGEDFRDVVKTAPHVVEGSFYSTREPHLPIEPDVMQAYYDSEGRLTIHDKSQVIYGQRNTIAIGLGLDPEQVRIIENVTGGSFGYGMSPTPPALIGACEMVLKVPVTWTMTYAEHQKISGKRSASYGNARMACDDNGKILGLEVDTCLDCGAYPDQATKLLFKQVSFFGYPYNIPSVNGVIRSALSNNTYAQCYRGYGMPQVYTTSEAITDMMAEEIGMDPFEFRYQNLLQPGDTICTNVEMDEYPLREMFDMIRPYYYEAKERAEKLSTDTIKRGVGVSCGGYSSAATGDRAQNDVELMPDGSITVYNTYEQVGQGADTATVVLAHEYLRPLGIKPEQINLVMNDSALCPDSNAAAGSKALYMNGNALRKATGQLIKAMTKEDGTYRTYDEMIAEGLPTKYSGVFAIDEDVGEKVHYIDDLIGYGRNEPEFNYSVYVSEVEVDTTTGKTKVVGMKAVYNCGVVANYNNVEGQAYGGYEHLVGFALKENYSSFKKKNMTMLGCGFPECNDIPDNMEFKDHVTPRPYGPHGSVGTAENFQSNGHMSIINAINNAIGVRVYELPATPEKILAGLAGNSLKPEKYYFGRDFYETYDELTDMTKAALAKDK